MPPSVPEPLPPDQDEASQMTAPNSTRREDWLRFVHAITGTSSERRHPCPILNYVLLVGHTGKNILVEEARRHGFELRWDKR